MTGCPIVPPLAGRLRGISTASGGPGGAHGAFFGGTGQGQRPHPKVRESCTQGH